METLVVLINGLLFLSQSLLVSLLFTMRFLLSVGLLKGFFTLTNLVRVSVWEGREY